MNIFKLFRTGSRGSGQVLIVDATGLITQHNRSGNGQGNPRDHALILKDLVRFASREGLEMIAVFTGRQLREASNGSNHKGVTVYYSDNRQELKKQVTTLVRKAMRRKNVMVLTSDQQVEDEAKRLRAECMRLSTLKKAFESKDEKGRTPVRTPANKADSARPSGRNSEPKGAATPNNTRQTAVLNLIDPV